MALVAADDALIMYFYGGRMCRKTYIGGDVDVDLSAAVWSKDASSILGLPYLFYLAFIFLFRLALHLFVFLLYIHTSKYVLCPSKNIFRRRVCVT